MHASAAQSRAATLLAALNAAPPAAESGSAAPSGLTFAELLGQHAADGAAAAQPVDGAMRSGATGAAAEAVETGAAARLRKFIARLLPSDATALPSEAAWAPDAAAFPQAGLQTTAALSAPPSLPKLLRADSIPAPQACASPLSVRASAPADPHAPTLALPGSRAAVAQAPPATGKAARFDLASAKSSPQRALLREGAADIAVETSAAAAPEPRWATPEPIAAQSLVATPPVSDAPHDLAHTIARDAAQAADNPTPPGAAPGAGLTLQAPPCAQTPETRALPATGSATRFEALDARPSGYSARAGARHTSHNPDAAGALQDFSAAPHARDRNPGRRPLGPAAEPNAGLALAAQVPTTSPEFPAGLRVAANPAQEGAALNSSPNTAPMSAAAALAPNATLISNAPPWHVELAVPVASPQFREAFALQVSVLARDGVQHAQVQLNPAELGPISVQITLDGQQAQIHFGCDSAQTRGLVEASLPTLAAQLRDAGLTLSGGGVSQHTPGQRHDFKPGREHRRSASEPDAAAAAPLLRTLRVATGRLDTYA